MKHKLTIEIHQYKDFFTIWLNFMNSYCPVQRFWKTQKGVEKFAEKIKKYHESPEFKKRFNMEVEAEIIYVTPVTLEAL